MPSDPTCEAHGVGRVSAPGLHPGEGVAPPGIARDSPLPELGKWPFFRALPYRVASVGIRNDESVMERAFGDIYNAEGMRRRVS